MTIPYTISVLDHLGFESLKAMAEACDFNPISPIGLLKCLSAFDSYSIWKIWMAWKRVYQLLKKTQ